MTTVGSTATWFSFFSRCINFFNNCWWKRGSGGDIKNSRTLIKKCSFKTDNWSINQYQQVTIVRRLKWLDIFYINTGNYKTEFEVAMGFYYAVARGRVPGVYRSWPECESQVKGFPNSRFKKFPSRSEAEAFIDVHKDGSAGGMTSKKTASATTTKQTYSAFGGVDQVDGFMGDYGRGQIGGGRSAMLGQTTSRFDKEFFPPVSTKSGGAIRYSKGRKKTMFTEPQPLLSSVPSRNISTTESLGKRGSSKIASDNKEFVTGKGNKKLKICDNSGVDLSSFETDDEDYVVVYTDGACKSNGKGQARAGIGVYFGESHFLNISARVKTRQTNNTAEIQAAERAIRCAKQQGITKLSLKTDSQFVLNCVGKWMSAWKRNNWRKGGPGGSEVINKDDLMVLDETMKGIEIKWSYIPAHKGHVGNEGADKLAVEGSLMPLHH